MAPQQGHEAKEDAPQPLVEGEGRCAEGVAAELDDDDLTTIGKKMVSKVEEKGKN